MKKILATLVLPLFLLLISATSAHAAVECRMRVLHNDGTRTTELLSATTNHSGGNSADLSMGPGSSRKLLLDQPLIWEFTFLKNGTNSICADGDSSLENGEHYVTVASKHAGIYKDLSQINPIPLNNHDGNECIGPPQNEATVRVTYTLDKEKLKDIDKDPTDDTGLYWKLAIRDSNIVGDTNICRFIFDISTILDNAQHDIGKFELCNQVPENKGRDVCKRCLEDKNGIWTALGCVPVNNQGLSIVQTLTQVGLGVSGLLSVIISLIASFILSVSRGTPQRVTNAREMLTAAATGLLFIIFSITILEFIGVDILQLPGFGTP